MEHININCETGEIIAIALTEDEQKEQELVAQKVIKADLDRKEKEKADLAAKQAAQTKLTALGLTLDDLAALGLQWRQAITATQPLKILPK